MRQVRYTVNSFENTAGEVLIWYYSVDHSYQLIWNYSEYDKFGRIHKDSDKEKSRKFFDIESALLKFQEIYLELQNKEKIIKNESKVNKLEKSAVILKEMDVIRAIDNYVRYCGCINCGDHSLILQIDSETGEVSGNCLTCRFNNSLQELLLYEKKLRDKYKRKTGCSSKN